MSGRRNEVARTKRRSNIKRAMSLTSVPKSEDNAARVSTTPVLNLGNHFTWEVLQKSQIGDGTFPHIFQYYEKPDLHGRDFEKVTYVLYMDKGTVVDKQSNIQREGTETAVSGILVSEKPSTPQEHYDKPMVQQPYYEREFQADRPKVAVATEENIMYLPDRRKRKKKIISEFYFVRRDRSRSAENKQNKYVYSDTGHDWQYVTPVASKTYLSQIDHSVSESEKNAMKETNRTVMTWKTTKNDFEEAAKSGKNGNYYADEHQLRAGAEKIEREYKELKDKYKTTCTSSEAKKSSKVMEYVKFKSAKHEIAEELLKTSSGTNQYLYVSGKTRQR